MGKERSILKHHADPSFPRGQISYIDVVQMDSSSVGFFESGNHAEHGRFPDTGTAEQDEGFALFQRETYPDQLHGPLFQKIIHKKIGGSPGCIHEERSFSLS